MFLSKRLIVAFCISTISCVYSQEAGYFGRKIVLEIGTMVQIPVFSNIFSKKMGFINRSGELKESYNFLDYTFRTSIGTILSENSAAAFEFDLRYYSVIPIRNGEINRQFTDSSGVEKTEFHQAEVEFLPIQELVFLPKAIFSTNSGRVPAGLTHEIGIGFSSIQLINRNLLVNSEDNPQLSKSIQNQLIDNRVGGLKGLVFMYGIRMNYPISKNLLFHIGVRYQYASLLEKRRFRKFENTESWISGRELWSQINQRRQLGIINLGIGFNLCF